MELQLRNFYLATLYSPRWYLGENTTLYLKVASVQQKMMCVLWCFKTKSLTRTKRWYRAQYGKDPPPDIALRRWLQQPQETGIVLQRIGAGGPNMRTRIMIESKKHFLEAHKNQLDEILCSYIHHKRLFGRLFITALTSTPTKCGLCRL
jgi:hypothetical protein